MKHKIFFFLFLIPTLAFSSSSLGEKLTHQFWHDFKHQNVHHLNAYLSSDFQGISALMKLSRANFLTIVPKTDIVNYSISSVTTTRRNNRLVITYGIKINEMHSNSPVAIFGPQMNVWEKHGSRWFLVSWSDLSVNVGE